MSPPGALPPWPTTTYQLTATMAATALPAASHTAASRRRCVRVSSKPFSAESVADREVPLSTSMEGSVMSSALASMENEAS